MQVIVTVPVLQLTPCMMLPFPAAASYEPPIGGLDAGMDNLSSVQTLGGQEAREDGITATLWSGYAPLSCACHCFH